MVVIRQMVNLVAVLAELALNLPLYNLLTIV